MTDLRLRELEREFLRTGLVADESAWLNERVRVGELTQDRIELAARLGNAAAGRIVKVPKPPRGLGDFLGGLIAPFWPATAGWDAIPLGWQASVRAMVAIARASSTPRDRRAEDELQSAISWCHC